MGFVFVKDRVSCRAGQAQTCHIAKKDGLLILLPLPAERWHHPHPPEFLLVGTTGSHHQAALSEGAGDQSEGLARA